MREIECNTMVYWTLRGFCVWKLGGSLAGDECKWGCGWWKYECVGRQEGLCVSCLIRVTSMRCIKLIRLFEDDVT